jgi:riboflavin synthase
MEAMFTGLVDGTGRIEWVRRERGEARLRVMTGRSRIPRGGSVGVDGVCLTVAASGRGWFEAVVSPESLARSTLGLRSAGDRVNLERPLRLGDPLGGHLVQGHVDATGVVEKVRPEGSGRRVRIAFPESLSDLIVTKGSIAVDGVSLTVAGRGRRSFEVALIPETLRVTHLETWAPGTPVNLEADMVGRYVVESLRTSGAGRRSSSEVTRDHLARHGFASAGGAS